MKIKIDYVSMFCWVLFMFIIQLICNAVGPLINNAVFAFIVRGVLPAVTCFVAGYYAYSVYKDGNWLVDNRVTSIRACNGHLLLNGVYKTKWLRKCRDNNICTCADFRTGTIWVQSSMHSCIDITRK